MRSLTFAAIAVAAAGCGLFLDDLSTVDPEVAREAGPDAIGADVTPGPPVDAGADREDGSVLESLDASDAADGTFALDCDGTVLCDGFEGRTTLPEAPVGEWRDNQLAGGTIAIVTGNAAAGQGYVDFVSPANTSTSSRLLLLGDNQLVFSNNESPTVVADLDMHIYGYAPLGTGDRRNFIGIYPYSNNSDGNQEYAGLSIAQTKGLHAEMRKYASAASTVRQGTDDPYDSFPLTTLTGGWHHVHLEARFARDATGSMTVAVDGVQVASIANVISRTNGSTANMFVFWIGDNAGPETPGFNVRYDNVEVRTK